MNEEVKDYGKVISKLRHKAGLTQKQLADKMELTVQTISNWENGLRVPRLTPQQTLSLCLALDCSLEDLIFSSNDESST